MAVLITIVIFLIIMIVLILTHELGHFITAKTRGVKVEEFGIGFPPRIAAIKRGETVYSLNAIPLGGFNKLAGEEDPKVPRGLSSKGFGTRLLVLSGGALMNAILPILLISLSLMIPHYTTVGQVIVTEVPPGSSAATAGLQTGDIILQINDNAIRNLGDLDRQIELNLGKQIVILVEHTNSTTGEVRITPRWKPSPNQSPITFGQQNSQVVRQYLPFWIAIPRAFVENVEIYILFKNSIISMIIGATPAVFTGPVGIAQMTGEVARLGLSSLLEFTAFLSINLAIVNILPLPALDGGRIAFVLLEWIRRGKRTPVRTEAIVHLIGFALLMGFVLLITYQDILRIIHGGSLT